MILAPSTTRESAAIVLLALTATLGCDGPVYHSVNGVVRLDGQPVPFAAVIFVLPNSAQAIQGATDAVGRYSLGKGTHSSVPTGEYRVAVKPLDNSTASAALSLPTRYAKADSSGLIVKVPSAAFGAYDLNLTAQ